MSAAAQSAEYGAGEMERMVSAMAAKVARPGCRAGSMKSGKKAM